MALPKMARRSSTGQGIPRGDLLAVLAIRSGTGSSRNSPLYRVVRTNAVGIIEAAWPGTRRKHLAWGRERPSCVCRMDAVSTCPRLPRENVFFTYAKHLRDLTAPSGTKSLKPFRYLPFRRREPRHEHPLPRSIEYSCAECKSIPAKLFRIMTGRTCTGRQRL